MKLKSMYEEQSQACQMNKDGSVSFLREEEIDHGESRNVHTIEVSTSIATITTTTTSIKKVTETRIIEVNLKISSNVVTLIEAAKNAIVKLKMMTAFFQSTIVIPYIKCFRLLII